MLGEGQRGKAWGRAADQDMHANFAVQCLVRAHSAHLSPKLLPLLRPGLIGKCYSYGNEHTHLERSFSLSLSIYLSLCLTSWAKFLAISVPMKVDLPTFSASTCAERQKQRGGHQGCRVRGWNRRGRA